MGAPLLIKQRPCRSWLNRETAPAISAALAQRLIDRCQGEEALMITLTYDHARWGWDPEKLFNAAADDQHVPLFFRRLQKYLGVSLKGRWLCKQEFQRFGWVHWHIVLVGVPFIEKKILAALWGWGFVNVRKAKRGRLRYVCKYASKDQDMPAWLYARRPRAVKIIRVSPGFWQDPDTRCSATPCASSEFDLPEEVSSGDSLSPADPLSAAEPCPPGHAEEDGPCPVVLGCVYRSIGDCIEQHRRRVVVRAERGRFCITLHSEPVLLLLAFLQRGCTLGPGQHGWLRIVGADRQMVEEAAAASREAAAAALDLTQVPNPDIPRYARWVQLLLNDMDTEEDREWRAAA